MQYIYSQSTFFMLTEFRLLASDVGLSVDLSRQQHHHQAEDSCARRHHLAHDLSGQNWQSFLSMIPPYIVLVALLDHKNKCPPVPFGPSRSMYGRFFRADVGVGPDRLCKACKAAEYRMHKFNRESYVDTRSKFPGFQNCFHKY